MGSRDEPERRNEREKSVGERTLGLPAGPPAALGAPPFFCHSDYYYYYHHFTHTFTFWLAHPLLALLMSMDATPALYAKLYRSIRAARQPLPGANVVSGRHKARRKVRCH